MINIHIVSSDYFFWNALDSLCIEIENDSEFNLTVIYPDSQMNEKKDYGIWKFSTISLSDYKIRENIPDVMIFSNPYDKLTQLVDDAEYIRDHVKLILAIPFIVVRYHGKNDYFWNMLNISMEKFKPDYYFFDSLVYNGIKDEWWCSDRFKCMGNPKYDEIYKRVTEHNKQEYLIGEWAKLKNKKVVLWCTTHLVKKLLTRYVSVAHYISFDVYSNCIFKYASENKDVGIIFRPHPVFLRELREGGVWSEGDLDKLRRYCKMTENVVLDESPDYSASYAVSDAILTDTDCGVITSALPMMKPICVLFRSHRVKQFDSELLGYYYKVYRKRKLIRFLDMVRESQDPMFEKRKKAAKKYVKNFDGNNGRRMKEFIKMVYNRNYREDKK